MTESETAARIPVGKAPAALLERLFRRSVLRDPRVIVGPQVGEDAAVIDLGSEYLVATADPITFLAEDIGWYAVQVNANDLAVRGARPAWFLMTLLLPENQATDTMLADIFSQVTAACEVVGASLVGGHTEVTAGLDRPILAGTMLGEVARDRIVTTAGARIGDTVLLSKGIAIEGASILARSFAAELTARGVNADLIASAQSFVRSPGISVLHDAQTALSVVLVHSMHDPTEGGLATGLVELATAAGVGLEIDRDAVPLLAECDRCCRALGVEPWGLIASGALLLTCAQTDAPAVLQAWQAAGIAGRVIGRVTPNAPGTVVDRHHGAPILPFARDEVARLFTEGFPPA
jgi:hydrogenase expression/formation protein HypE